MDPQADPLPLLLLALSQSEGQEGRDPSRNQVTEWPVARDLGAADWGKAFNSHRGCVLGPGHTAAPLVSQGGSSAHLFAGQHWGGVGEFLTEEARLAQGLGVLSADPGGQAGEGSEGPGERPLRRARVLSEGFGAPELLPALPPGLSFLPPPCREDQGPLEIDPIFLPQDIVLFTNEGKQTTLALGSETICWVKVMCLL